VECPIGSTGNHTNFGLEFAGEKAIDGIDRIIRDLQVLEIYILINPVNPEQILLILSIY
jgi:hypothetical protein